MPSAATANGKSEKAASSEATDNSPIRQIMTIIEHKIRNLEKRKSKLTSYRDLQKAGKELKADQKVAVAKYDEVAQTLEFARDLSKQVTSIAISADREAKKLAKKETWVRYTADTNKIREVLLIQDCLTQMGCSEAREHFLNGTNGAAKLSEDDLKVLDELYPEVTPKHEANEDGQPGFQAQVIKAADHLYAIIDGKPKEVLGTTYSHVKEVIAAITECGYFDKTPDVVNAELVSEENCVPPVEETQEVVEELVEPVVAPVYPAHVSIAVAPAVVPAAYPIRPHTTVTLQEIEHAYFAQQYPPQQRPIAEVIGSQNFFFLQESEIDSPVGTPQPPQILNQPSPPAPIPTQTFTNQHYVQIPRVGEPNVMPLQHYPHPEVFSAVPLPQVQPLTVEHAPQQQPQQQSQPHPQSQPNPQPPSRLEERDAITPTAAPAPADSNDEWYEGRSPERDETERKSHGQGDAQNRFRRYNRGGGRPSNGYRGRGGFQSRQSGDGYHGQYQGRSNQSRQYGGDGYQSRHGNNKDGYYGNGDAADTQNENGRDRYGESSSYGGGFKSRGRGGSGRGGRGAPSGGAGRGPRAHHFRKHDGGAE